MKKKYKSVWLIVLLLIGGVRLAAIDEVTLFRVFLTDGSSLVTYGEFARVGELVLDFLQIFETREVSGRTDGRHHERLTHRRLTECLEGHAIAGLVESLEIFNHLTPRGEFAIVAGRESEDVGGGGDLWLGGGYSR